MFYRHCLYCLLCLTAWLPVCGWADPLCVPQGSVPELPDNPSHGWLTRQDADQTRAYLQQFAAGESRWEGGALIVRCEIEGSESNDMTVAHVESAGPPMPGVGFDKKYFTDLAQRTGHTDQEADVLYNKYTRLQGVYFRQVPDGQGGFMSEGQAIFDRHKAQAPSAPAPPSAGERQSKEMQAKALKEKIKAAQARGDMQEMMRLAAEAQQLNAPMMAQAERINQGAADEQWRMLENAYGELAQAAYRVRVTPAFSACLQCSWSE